MVTRFGFCYRNHTRNPFQVMFRFAIEHVSRVSRIIAQPGGNAMLIGVGGSGRSSAAKLATFIQDYECFQLEITRTYSLNDFKDDMKKLLLRQAFKIQF